MRSKYGFEDGEAVPDGAEEYRTVYVAALNKAAAKFGSALEAYPYDRPGMHNHCLILFRPKGSTLEEEKEPDEGMEKAIELCEEFYDIDEFVEVEVSIVGGFEQELDNLIASEPQV